ncbi:MAG: hypothetical protein GWP10_07235 [Nitrospiraceae bacterium]|nr:hypothetical protein [Nitrospiraceae bacterium]
MRKILTILIIIISIYFLGDMVYIYQKYKPIENVLQEMSSREYTENYKCVQFSEDAVKMLAEKGIQASMISGKKNGKWHRWIAIEFKPQTGEILKPNEYETILLSKNR